MESVCIGRADGEAKRLILKNMDGVWNGRAVVGWGADFEKAGIGWIIS